MAGEPWTECLTQSNAIPTFYLPGLQHLCSPSLLLEGLFLGACWWLIGFTVTAIFGICCLNCPRSPSFVAPGAGFMGDSVSTAWVWGKASGRFKRVYSALYFSYCYIGSTSEHQALDPGSRGTLSYYQGQYSPKQGKILPLKLPHAPHGETLYSSRLGAHEVG